jgi:hypothetical protein
MVLFPLEVIPESHPGQPHAEIHGREGKIDQPQVERRGEPVALDRLVVLLQPVADKGCGKIPSERAPDPEGDACPFERLPAAFEFLRNPFLSTRKTPPGFHVPMSRW